MKKILIIVDDTNKKWLNDSRIQAGREVEICLLTLGITSENYERINKKYLKAVKNYYYYPVEEIAETARNNVQENYPQFIFDLSRMPVHKGKNIVEMLQIKDMNMWWLTDTSEKSALRGYLVNHIYYLELINLAINKDKFNEIWICLRSPALSDTIQSLIKIGHHKPIFKVCIKNRFKRTITQNSFITELILRRLRLWIRVTIEYFFLYYIVRPKPLLNKNIYFVSSFPHLWIAPFTDNPLDRMYAKLPDVLGRWKKVGYLVWFYLPIIELWRDRKLLNRFIKKKEIISILLQGRFKDILSIISVRNAYKIIKVMKALVKLSCYNYNKYNILPLILHEFRYSFLRGELPLDILRTKCYERLTKKTTIDIIIHWGEFQSSERAIWYGVKSSNTKTVAFQHSTCSPMFLNYQFLANEIKEYRSNQNKPNSMPFPTLFVSTGKYAIETLAKAGFDKRNMTTCGAIRYGNLIDFLQSAKTKNDLRNEMGISITDRVILLVTASKYHDNLNMVEAIIEVLEQYKNHENITLIVKCHPLLDMKKEIAAMIGVRHPWINCVPFSTDTLLFELMAISDVMVGNSSASGLESIAIGVTPIFYHNPNLYDVSVLYSLQDSILMASTAKELSVALDRVFNDEKYIAKLRATWKNALDYYYYAMDNKAEERFKAFLISKSA